MRDRGRLILAIISLALLLAAAALFWQDSRGGRRIGALSQVAVGQPSEGILEVDWDRVRAESDRIVAWCRVGGTGIDTPVVHAADRAEENYWLSHDLAGEYSQPGTPYLLPACDPDEGAQIVLGHHFAYGDLAFTEIYDCWRPERFETLTGLLWATPGKGTLVLKPLCALKVDKADQEAQVLAGAASVTETRAWLASMCSRADAACEDWEELAGSSTRTVVLVTCSELLPFQRSRTIVIFAG